MIVMQATRIIEEVFTKGSGFAADIMVPSSTFAAGSAIASPCAFRSFYKLLGNPCVAVMKGRTDKDKFDIKFLACLSAHLVNPKGNPVGMVKQQRHTEFPQ
jgi:hypothetical protein